MSVAVSLSVCRVVGIYVRVCVCVCAWERAVDKRCHTADGDPAPDPSTAAADACPAPKPSGAAGEECSRVDSGQWACFTCTLINAVGNAMCAVCGGERPATTSEGEGLAQTVQGRERDAEDRHSDTAEEQAQERMGNAIQRMMGQVTDMGVARAALDTVLGVLMRIQQKPDDTKLRRLRLANPALMEKVGKVEGGFGLLLASGFRYSSDALFAECPPSVSQMELAICASLVASALEMLPE